MITVSIVVPVSENTGHKHPQLHELHLCKHYYTPHYLESQVPFDGKRCFFNKELMLGR